MNKVKTEELKKIRSKTALINAFINLKSNDIDAYTLYQNATQIRQANSTIDDKRFTPLAPHLFKRFRLRVPRKIN